MATGGNDTEIERQTTVVNFEIEREKNVINSVFKEAEAAIACQKRGLAEKLILKAERKMSEFKNRLLNGEACVVDIQLAVWYEKAHVLFDEVGQRYKSVECIYTAILFNERVRDDLRITLMWQNILKSENLQTDWNNQKIHALLGNVTTIAKAAEKREMYGTALNILCDVEKTHSVLFQFYGLGTPWSENSAYMSTTLAMARCYYLLGHHEEARQMCSLAQEHPKHVGVKALKILIKSYAATGDYEKAIEWSRKALEYPKIKESDKKLLQVSQKRHIIKAKENQEKRVQDWLKETNAFQAEQSKPTRDIERKPSSRQPPRKAIPKEKHIQNQVNPNTKLQGKKQSKENVYPQKFQMDSRNESDIIKSTKDISSSPLAQGSISKVDYEVPFSESDGSISDSESVSESFCSNDMVEQSDNSESFYSKSLNIYKKIDMDNGIVATSDQRDIMKNGLTFSQDYLSCIEQNNKSKRKDFYETMLSENETKRCLTTDPDKYKRCIIQIKGCHSATCTPLISHKDITTIAISGRSKAGKAFSGDEVVVEILTEDEQKQHLKYGKVVSILNRCHEPHPVFLCTLDDVDKHLVRPLCRTVPKIDIFPNESREKFKKKHYFEIEKYVYKKDKLELSSTEHINPADINARVLKVVILQWKTKQRSIYPIGAVLEILECRNSVQSGLKILNLKYNKPTLYSRPCTEDVEKLMSSFMEPDCCPERKDLTKLKVFTIDPSESKDLDDALSIEQIDEGYKVGIHISDVSHFVKKGDNIDKDARQQLVTFYSIVGNARHMLPEPLSEKICSLVPNMRRYAISTFFYLTEKGRPMQGKSREIMKSVVQSTKRYTYSEIQEIINCSKTGTMNATPEVVLLYKLAKNIRFERLGNSMFATSSSEFEDEIETEDGLETIEAHYLVEEFMLMTNARIARLLVNKFPEMAPLRCQLAPTQENHEAFLKAEGDTIDTVARFQDKRISPSTKASILKAADDAKENIVVQKRIWNTLKKNPIKNKNYILTDDIHPMQHLALMKWIQIQEPAQYKCSGCMKSVECEGRHYSLDTFSYYTQFTSPIRRYMDLVVHRIVSAFIEKSQCPYSKKEIEQICIEMNSATKRAKAYGKECKMLAKAIELRANPRMMTCFIDDISDKGVTFSTQGLVGLPTKASELSFNVLNMGFKPELTTHNQSKHDKIKTTWKRRIYDTKGISTSLPTRSLGTDEILQICPNQTTIAIPRIRWTKLFTCIMEDRLQDFSKQVNNIQVIDNGTGLPDVTTECMDLKMMQPYTKFSMTYSRGQILDIQMTAELNKGIPEIKSMLYDMTANNKCCLQHTDDPVRYLSHYSTKGTLEQYSSPELYNEILFPIIEMEAALGATSSTDYCTVNNVPIKFKGKKGRFALSIDFCEKRNIFEEVIGDVENEEGAVNSHSSSYDWLCIKYCCDQNASAVRSAGRKYQTVWVGHAKVTKMLRKKKNDKLIVRFYLHQSSPKLPDEVVSGVRQHRFSVDVLVKNEVDRRTETYLRRLINPRYIDSLANRIALNDCCMPDLETEELELAKELQKWDLIIPEGKGVKPIPGNNYYQQKAIDKALMSSFSLIQGPPGTGKTYTGVKLVYLFTEMNKMREQNGMPRKQVLFCGPSNKSVDLVGRIMKRRLGELCPDFVRVYGRITERTDFPIPGHPLTAQRIIQTDPTLRGKTLHHLIREKEYSSEINKFDKMFRLKGYRPEMQEVKEYKNLIKKASVAEIGRHDVILCTTAVGARPSIIQGANVLQVIIDEAGMCTEPQCMLPIIATNAKQVVLIGDHKQLRPVIKCKQASELGLKKSLFERYAMSNSKRAHNVKFTLLDIQYRMTPELCYFPSKQFYEDKLLTRPGIWAETWPLTGTWPCQPYKGYPDVIPHVFVDVRGEVSVLTVSAEEGNEQSRSNKAEVDHVVKVVRFLYEDKAIDSKNMNIISQYNSQIHQLKKAVRDIDDSKEFNVNTVSASQGGEWDYVIFSTVASLPDYKIEKTPTLGWCKQNLGFITDENQINVALTRARKGLIIVGNSRLLRCDTVWGNLLQTYERLGCLLSPEQFPPHQRYPSQ